jgi:hypothetical protein
MKPRPWWLRLLLNMKIVVNCDDEDFGEKMKFGVKFMRFKF